MDMQINIDRILNTELLKILKTINNVTVQQ